MKEDILKELDETTAELLKTISLFTQEQFNTVPFEGSWTAAQVVEHLLKSESGIPKMWRGNTAVTSRPVDEKVVMIKSIFLDFNKKMNSPEFIVPSEAVKNKESIHNAIQNNRTEIRNLAETMDLTVSFPDAPFPQMGVFTGIEWATFLICHSIRHTRQMKNIYEKLK